MPGQRHLSRRSLLEVFPALDSEAFVGAVRYYDAGTDDARLVVALARTAAREGAVIATSCRAVGVARTGDRVTGLRVVDLESGREITVEAGVVINATGVWTDQVELFVEDPVRHVSASKGIHLVVPMDRIDASTGLITKTERSVLFIIPFHHQWLIGTTDTPWNLDLAHPAACAGDIDYLLGEVNSLLAEPLDRTDVVGVYAGLRPLVRGEPGPTTKLSREHAVTSAAPGLVSIAGGKLTTYRVMAADVVDAAVAQLGNGHPNSRTAEIPLVGSEGWDELWRNRERMAAGSGVPVATVEHLLRRHGSDTGRLLGMVGAHPNLGERLHPAADYLKVEVVWAARVEGALHLDDLLTRRTRISIEVVDRGVAVAAETARLVAPILGWDQRTIAREVEHYAARVAAELDSQMQHDDLTADAARMGAPDVRMMGR